MVREPWCPSEAALVTPSNIMRETWTLPCRYVERDAAYRTISYNPWLKVDFSGPGTRDTGLPQLSHLLYLDGLRRLVKARLHLDVIAQVGDHIAVFHGEHGFRLLADEDWRDALFDALLGAIGIGRRDLAGGHAAG